MADIDAVERELAAGRIWRAKEILQGRLRSAGYDAVLYERYGFVLFQLGDMAEAGKYLFLSGIRKPEYREPIEIYIHRHGKSLRTLHDTFPACVRRTGAASYPEGVLTDLQAAGWSLRDLKIASRKDAPADSSSWELWVGLSIAAVFLALFAGFLVQGLRGLRWLIGFFSGG
jgi:hypothetical protein